MKNLIFVGLILSAIFYGCKPLGPSGPPSPSAVCATSNIVSGHCSSFFEYATDVTFGNGALKLDVLGTTASNNFSTKTHFTPNGWSTSGTNQPAISLNNGTVNSYPHFLSGPSVNFEVPSRYSYTVKASYIEYDASYPSNSTTGNTSGCALGNPVNKCNVYTKMHTLSSNTITYSCLEYNLDIPTDNPIKGACQ